MSSNNGPLRLPPRPRSPQEQRSQSTVSRRSTSSMSIESPDSQANAFPVQKRSPYMHPPVRPSTAGGPSSSTASLQNFSRPAARQRSIDQTMRTNSPNGTLTQAQIGHRPRQHSQGFFEPSLPSSMHQHGLSSLTASQIAAQAAMQHVQTSLHERKRSASGLAPINTAATMPGRRRVSPMHSPQLQQSGGTSYQNGTVGGNSLAAATAANAAFPRSPLPSPNSQALEHPHPHPHPHPPPAAAVAAPEKTKERSKMKLFSKPKSIGIIKDKDLDRKQPALPSPSKNLLRSGFANASTTSLLDPSASSASSIYSSANASTSTLVPTNTQVGPLEKEKEKHRHHFLSRQKHKLGNTSDHRNLPLSSASSNSQAVDPSAPQPLYSFAPQSPGPSSSFAKTVSGLDLRHGGRALREKKREEKAAAAGLTPILSNSSANLPLRDTSFSIEQRGEFVGPSSLESTSVFGPPTASTTSIFSFPSLEQSASLSQAAFNNLGNTMGLTGITPDDAWPLLKARLLNIFEGEDLRTPIEDFNMLVSVHILRCVQKRAPVVLIEDLRELLQTGFSSIAQTLRRVPDDRLVPKLVDVWVMVFGHILPFIQAVFLPLDLEFKGRGAIMSAREASEFWGAIPDFSRSDERPSSSGGTLRLPSLGEELDVRRMALITFRDVVILPKNDALMTIFSRLSLDSINATPLPPDSSSSRTRGFSNATTGAERPGTGGSLSPRFSSFNSQGSTLLDAASSSSGGALSHTHSRSRATSNTSAGSFGTSLPHLPSPLHSVAPTSAPPPLPQPSPPMADPAQVTEMVARMLQCVSVLASVQTGDSGQGAVERLTGALKYNWLGRGRTGRQRRGWVGMRVGARTGVVGA